MTTMCRICTFEESDSTETLHPVSQTIIEMIEFCTGVRLQYMNELPSKICKKCHEDLRISHSFKMRCINSDKAFLELQSNKLKIEIFESETDIKMIECFNYEVFSCDEIKNEGILKLNCDNILKNKGRPTDEKNVSLQIEKKKQKRQTPISSKPGAAKNLGLSKFKARKKLFCKECQIAFVSRTEQLEHKKKFHKRKWICEVCGKAYQHRSSQISHRNSHLSTRYACDNCDYSTYNKNDLVKHFTVHSGIKAYKCSLCAAAYRTSSNLRAHARAHEPSRPHACHVCEKTYKCRNTLQRHIDTHSNIRRFVCDVCHANFTRRSYWKQHLERQHGVTVPACRPGPQPKLGVPP